VEYLIGKNKEMQQKNDLYKYFIGLYAIVAIVTVWNIHEQHKLRELQKEDLMRKGNGNGKTN
tara:strand:- start:4412 stop:4597 length:186 start_codon:yes stop_codon:yes gene_type:complete